MARFKLTLDADKITVDDMSAKVERHDSSNGKEAAMDIINLLKKLRSQPSGSQMSIELDRNAQGTVTANAVQPNDTVTVAGEILTAVASSPSTDEFACGTLATLVIQDLTYTAVARGEAGNNVSIEYVGGGTAGAEVVTVTDSAIEIQIEDGVSTATQVKAAFDAESDATNLATVAVTGTGATAQFVGAEDYLAGGVGNNLLTAISLQAAAIANTAITDDLSVSRDSNVITLTAKEPGPDGDAITLATNAASRLVLSGATLSGGADAQVVTYTL